MYQRMTCEEIYNYWDQLRGEDGAPLRSAIEPASLAAALPDLFMLEAEPEGNLRFRLVGTRMCSLFGRELRGESFIVLWAGGRESNAMDIARGVILYESPALINVTGFGENAATCRYEMLLLPVRANDGRCDRLLGALVPVSDEEKLIYPYTLNCLLMDRSRPLTSSASHGFAASCGQEALQDGDDPWELPLLPPRKAGATEDLSWNLPGNHRPEA